MLTGVLGLVFSYRAQQEQEVVKFAAYPSAGLSDLTGGGLGVRVQLVNQSLRPVIVRSASLWQGKKRLAAATGYLPNARVLDRADADPSTLVSGLADFPLNLGAREGRAAAFVLDVWSGVSDSPSRAAAAARNNLNLTLKALDPDWSPKLPLTLELDLSPGGHRRFALKDLNPLTAAQRATQEVATAPQANWVVAPLGSPPKLIGLLLRHASAGIGEVDLVRLDVWKQDSSLHRSITRPVLSEQATTFPLIELPRGAYAVTFELGGRVIANRSFSLPWRREPCAVGLQEAATSDGSPSPAWC
jgi:hypothetical protein